MDPRVGLDGFRKSHPNRDSIPEPSTPSRVVILTTLSRSTVYTNSVYIYMYQHILGMCCFHLQSSPLLGLHTNPHGVRSQTNECSLAFLPHIWDHLGLKLKVQTGQPQPRNFPESRLGNAVTVPPTTSLFLLHNDQFIIRSCIESSLVHETASLNNPRVNKLPKLSTNIRQFCSAH